VTAAISVIKRTPLALAPRSSFFVLPASLSLSLSLASTHPPTHRGIASAKNYFAKSAVINHESVARDRAPPLHPAPLPSPPHPSSLYFNTPHAVCIGVDGARSRVEKKYADLIIRASGASGPAGVSPEYRRNIAVFRSRRVDLPLSSLSLSLSLSLPRLVSSLSRRCRGGAGCRCSPLLARPNRISALPRLPQIPARDRRGKGEGPSLPFPGDGGWGRAGGRADYENSATVRDSRATSARDFTRRRITASGRPKGRIPDNRKRRGTKMLIPGKTLPWQLGVTEWNARPPVDPGLYPFYHSGGASRTYDSRGSRIWMEPEERRLNDAGNPATSPSRRNF